MLVVNFFKIYLVAWTLDMVRTIIQTLFKTNFLIRGPQNGHLQGKLKLYFFKIPILVA